MQYSDYIHSHTCLSNLNKLREQGCLCDVSLIVSDMTISAHKNVLSACSEYFRAMFNGMFPESTQTDVILKDLDPNAVNHLVNYMYTGTIDITFENVRSLLQTASYLQLHWVQHKCCLFLALRINVKNCLGIMTFADEYSCTKLKEYAEFYAAKNLPTIAVENEFQYVGIDVLTRLIDRSSKNGNVNDNERLKAVLRWIEFDRVRRNSYLNELLETIHPALVSKDLVKGSTVLLDSSDCTDWVSKCIDPEIELNIFVIDTTNTSKAFQRLSYESRTVTKLADYPSEVFAYTTIGYNHLVFAQGGRDQIRISAPESFCYNIYRDEWRNLTPLLQSRWGHYSCVVNDAVYSIGGYNEFMGGIKSVECLNLTTARRYRVADMLNRRLCMAGAVYENCIYIMGGENEEVFELRKAERYDPRVGCWEPIAKLNERTSFCTGAVISDVMYCLDMYHSGERYDFRMDRWERYDFGVTSIYDMFAKDDMLFGVSRDGVVKFDFASREWEELLKWDENGLKFDSGFVLDVCNV